MVDTGGERMTRTIQIIYKGDNINLSLLQTKANYSHKVTLKIIEEYEKELLA